MVGKDGQQPSHGDAPSLRQRLHSATGDRDAEAAALADRSDDVSEETAREAVRRAHGDVTDDGHVPDADLATVADAEVIGDEERG